VVTITTIVIHAPSPQIIAEINFAALSDLESDADSHVDANFVMRTTGVSTKDVNERDDEGSATNAQTVVNQDFKCETTFLTMRHSIISSRR
jgi:hypothetical protein